MEGVIIMAIFDVKKEEDKDLIQLYRKLNYITNRCATTNNLIYGSSVSVVEPYEEMEAVTIAFNNIDLDIYKHCVLSIEEDEEIDILDFKDLAIAVGELIGNFNGHFQVLVAVHANTDNLHVHYVVNMTDYLNGKRLDVQGKKLYELKDQISFLLEKWGLKGIRRKNK